MSERLIIGREKVVEAVETIEACCATARFYDSIIDLKIEKIEESIRSISAIATMRPPHDFPLR